MQNTTGNNQNNNSSSTSSFQSTTNSALAKDAAYQVLNISNVNALGEVVLNDEKLLALIQNYPFLYNPHVRPHNDPDYDDWAWEQIANFFNRNYEPLNQNVRYSPSDLKTRWQQLQPIVRSLSKLNNLSSLPDSLRNTVTKLKIPLEGNQPNAMLNKPITNAQQTILNNTHIVSRLSLEQRRCLEAEIIDLILQCELESKATIKLSAVEQQKINTDYFDFLRTIRLKELHVSNENAETTKVTPRETADNSNKVNLKSKETSMQQNNDTELENGNDVIIVEEDVDRSPVDDLLEPLEPKRWVPLSCWRDYVRNCRVRIKRTTMEDDIPLARIKREHKDV